MMSHLPSLHSPRRLMLLITSAYDSETNAASSMMALSSSVTARDDTDLTLALNSNACLEVWSAFGCTDDLNGMARRQVPSTARLLNLIWSISALSLGWMSLTNMLCLATGSTLSTPPEEYPMGMDLATQSLTWLTMSSMYLRASILCWVVPQYSHVTYGLSSLICDSSKGAPQNLHLNDTISSISIPYPHRQAGDTQSRRDSGSTQTHDG